MHLRLEIAGLARIWRGIRQVFGDAAYEDYLRSQQRVRQNDTGKPPAADPAGATPTLTREEFYLDALRRRYSGVSRCC